MRNRFMRDTGKPAGEAPQEAAPPARVEPIVIIPGAAAGGGGEVQLPGKELLDARVRLHRKLIDDLNLASLERLPREELRRKIGEFVADYVKSERILLNAKELEAFSQEVFDELTGLGPLEPLLKDPTISDILINTHEKVYVERHGKLEAVPVRFSDEAHILRIVNKIVGAVGRRVDEFLADDRRASGGRLPYQRRDPAYRGRRPADLDQKVRGGSLRPAEARQLRQPQRANG